MKTEFAPAGGLPKAALWLPVRRCVFRRSTTRKRSKRDLKGGQGNEPLRRRSTWFPANAPTSAPPPPGPAWRRAQLLRVTTVFRALGHYSFTTISDRSRGSFSNPLAKQRNHTGREGCISIRHLHPVARCWRGYLYVKIAFIRRARNNENSTAGVRGRRLLIDELAPRQASPQVQSRIGAPGVATHTIVIENLLDLSVTNWGVRAGTMWSTLIRGRARIANGTVPDHRPLV
jgi:hypothetical protein